MNQETNDRCTILLANFVHSPDPLSLKNTPCSAENPTFFKCPKCCSKNAPSRPEIMYTRFCGSAESFSRASRVGSDGIAADLINETLAAHQKHRPNALRDDLKCKSEICKQNDE